MIIRRITKKKIIEAIRWILQYNKSAPQRNTELFDLNLPGGSARFTPIHLACHCGYYKIARELVNAGVELFNRNSYCRTPRQAAKCHIGLFKYMRKVENLYILKKFQTSENSPDDSISNLRSDTLFTNKLSNLQIQVEIKQVKARLQEPPTYPQSESFQSSAVMFAPQPNIMGLNIYFLKSKILDNEAKVYERFEALGLLIGSPHSSARLETLKEILEGVLNVACTALQLAIISNADKINSISTGYTLRRLLLRARSPLLISEISTVLEFVENEFSHRPCCKTNPYKRYTHPPVIEPFSEDQNQSCLMTVKIDLQ